jgi:arylsulfatase A-like enzyme
MTVTRRRFLEQAGAAGLLAAAPALLRGQPRTRKPNFIIILCDDLGFGDIGVFGGTSIKTPHIDQMAREGVRLTDYYSAANLCTPSRAGLLTGRYAVRTGLAHEVLEPRDDRGLPLTEVTIAKALKSDYVSAIIGKWHLGHIAPYWPPTNHGFDLFFGLPYSHDMTPLSLYEQNGPGVELTQEDVDFPQLQQRFYRRAVKFIEDNRDRPFFIDLSLSAPHLPEYPHPPFAGTSRAGAYGDVVVEIDDIVVRLLAKLRDLRLDRDTLVVFTSDNGPWFEGSSGPLRDRKGGGAWDGGFRVPFVAWRPGTVPAGQTRSGIAMGIDFLPTLCAMAGVAPPRGVELDGRDITPVLTSGAASPHDQLLLFNNEDIFGIRTQRWKYVKFSYFRSRQESFDERGYEELFDLEIDPGENYSVAARHPDVIADMQRRMTEARRIFDPLKPLNPALGVRTPRPR